MIGWRDVGYKRRESEAIAVKKQWEQKGYKAKITRRRLGIAYAYRIWVRTKGR